MTPDRYAHVDQLIIQSLVLYVSYGILPLHVASLLGRNFGPPRKYSVPPPPHRHPPDAFPSSPASSSDDPPLPRKNRKISEMSTNPHSFGSEHNVVCSLPLLLAPCSPHDFKRATWANEFGSHETIPLQPKRIQNLFVLSPKSVSAMKTIGIQERICICKRAFLLTFPQISL